MCFFSISLLPPTFPPASLFGQVIGDAFALAVVGYGIAISLGRILAIKYGYQVDSNQVGTEMYRYFFLIQWSQTPGPGTTSSPQMPYLSLSPLLYHIKY